MNGLPLSSVVLSNDLTKLSSSQALALLTNLSSSSFDASSAKALASNIPTNINLASLNHTAYFTVYVPIQLIENTNASQLASLVIDMDLALMTADRSGYIGSQVRFILSV